MNLTAYENSDRTIRTLQVLYTMCTYDSNHSRKQINKREQCSNEWEITWMQFKGKKRSESELKKQKQEQNKTIDFQIETSVICSLCKWDFHAEHSHTPKQNKKIRPKNNAFVFWTIHWKLFYFHIFFFHFFHLFGRLFFSWTFFMQMLRNRGVIVSCFIFSLFLLFFISTKGPINGTNFMTHKTYSLRNIFSSSCRIEDEQLQDTHIGW